LERFFGCPDRFVRSARGFRFSRIPLRDIELRFASIILFSEGNPCDCVSAAYLFPFFSHSSQKISASEAIFLSPPRCRLRFYSLSILTPLRGPYFLPVGKKRLLLSPPPSLFCHRQPFSAGAAPFARPPLLSFGSLERDVAFSRAYPRSVTLICCSFVLRRRSILPRVADAASGVWFQQK